MLKARVKWVEGLQFVGSPPSNNAIVMDSSTKGGGADSAVHPGELVLLALAGCTGMDVISILQKMRQEVHDFQVRIEAEAAEEHPKAFRRIKVSYYVRGKDIQKDKLLHAIELSQTKYCSVSATLKSEVKIDWDFEIAGE